MCALVCVRVHVFVWFWFCAADMQRVVGISRDSQVDISIDFDVDNPSQVPPG